SVQFHLQVSPQDYAVHWNAAQCIAGVQVALGANSPFLFGRQLWRETRIALFEQATDTRPQELKAQGVRPRVWFGERWITSVFDNSAFYFGLLRVLAEQDRPVWSQMSFATAEENFTVAARDGIHAQLYWPGLGTVPVTELVLRRLLPLAREGLDRWGVDSAVS